MKTSHQKRVLLDEQAFEGLERMLAKLKEEGKFLKVNHARLSSWIIKKFEEALFIKCKQEIIKECFDSKEYLKDLASKIDGNENAKALLSDTLNVLQARSLTQSVVEKNKKEK